MARATDGCGEKTPLRRAHCHPDLFPGIAPILFRNEGHGRFAERALLAGAAVDEDGRVYAGMGVDFADYDNARVGQASVIAAAVTLGRAEARGFAHPRQRNRDGVTM